MKRYIHTIQIAAVAALIALNVITQTCAKILKEEISE